MRCCRLATCDKNRLLTGDKVEGVVSRKGPRLLRCATLAVAQPARESHPAGESRRLEPLRHPAQHPGGNHALPPARTYPSGRGTPAGLNPPGATYADAQGKRTVSPRPASTVDRCSSRRIRPIRWSRRSARSRVPGFQRRQARAIARPGPWLRLIDARGRRRRASRRQRSTRRTRRRTTTDITALRITKGLEPVGSRPSPW